MFSAAHAQWSHIDFSAGGGFSEPEGRAGNNLNTGWNVDFRGGYKPARNLALDLDFNYNRWNLNNAALGRYGEPNGYTTIWSLSFLPVFHGSPHWHVAPYPFGGPGLYYRNLTLTTPALINTIFCDPFFGFCYPATFGVNQVVASSTTYKMGVNGGAGIEVRLGESHIKAFGEARYSRMFTTHGTDLTFVPVTFGLRW
jgi:opacity protein-like surface antigen